KAAYSISEFCRDHSISRGLFYKLKKLGLTPREIELGSRRIITREAAADWRAQNTACPCRKFHPVGISRRIGGSCGGCWLSAEESYGLRSIYFGRLQHWKLRSWCCDSRSSCCDGANRAVRHFRPLIEWSWVGSVTYVLQPVVRSPSFDPTPWCGG